VEPQSLDEIFSHHRHARLLIKLVFDAGQIPYRELRDEFGDMSDLAFQRLVERLIGWGVLKASEKKLAKATLQVVDKS
jgi:hypothetical protein